jgi:hypothetical protein
MQVAVANGAWRHGSIISVRLGDIRRQAPLDVNTTFTFPRLEASSSSTMQVDIFSHVATTVVELTDGRTDVVDLDVSSEGFSNLALRVLPESDEATGAAAIDIINGTDGSASSGPRQRLEAAIARDRDIEQTDFAVAVIANADGASTVASFSSPVPPPEAPPSNRRPASRVGAGRSGSGSPTGGGEDHLSGERMAQVRQAANDYIERHGLRQVLHDLFQKTVRDRPDRPFELMRTILCEADGGNSASPGGALLTASVEAGAQESLRVEREEALGHEVQSQRLQIQTLQKRNVLLEEQAAKRTAAVESDAAEEEKRLAQEQELEQVIASCTEEIKSLKEQVNSDAQEKLQRMEREQELQALVASQKQRLEALDAVPSPKPLDQSTAQETVREKALQKEIEELKSQMENVVKMSPGCVASVEADAQVEQDRELRDEVESLRLRISVNSPLENAERMKVEQELKDQINAANLQMQALKKEKAELLSSSKQTAEAAAGASAQEQAARIERERALSGKIASQSLELESLKTQNAALQGVNKQALETAAAANESRRIDSARLQSQQTVADALQLRIRDLESATPTPVPSPEFSRSGSPPRPESRAVVAATQELAQANDFRFNQELQAKQSLIDSLQARLLNMEKEAMWRPGTASTGLPGTGPPGSVNTVPSAMQGLGNTMPPEGMGFSGVTSEMNTQMLTQLMASSYAAPVPPTNFFEPREDSTEDTDAKPACNPELLIEIVDCKDKTANGTYANVGVCNKRPLYRLVGQEPRYLYFACVDPTWQGWWISDKMGAEDYVEWFSQPSEAKLPIYCKRGELGSRVVEANLTRELVQQISLIGSQSEKATIRKKLMEAFGATFSKLDGTQRGLMAKTSPVVGVAHALESQQRAIQLLHSQLSLETKHRQAAEAHALTMEEAFETLHLRIQAQIPGGGGTAGLAALGLPGGLSAVAGGAR